MNKMRRKIILKGKNAARGKKETSSDREQVRMECLMYVCQISTCRHTQKRNKKESFYFHKAVGCGAYIVG